MGIELSLLSFIIRSFQLLFWNRLLYLHSQKNAFKCIWEIITKYGKSQIIIKKNSQQ